jgi:hypothetical protein
MVRGTALRPHCSTPLEHSAAAKLSPCWLPDWLPGAAHRTRTRLFGSRGHHIMALGKAWVVMCMHAMHACMCMQTCSMSK